MLAKDIGCPGVGKPGVQRYGGKRNVIILPLSLRREMPIVDIPVVWPMEIRIVKNETGPQRAKHRRGMTTNFPQPMKKGKHFQKTAPSGGRAGNTNPERKCLVAFLSEKTQTGPRSQLAKTLSSGLGDNIAGTNASWVLRDLPRNGNGTFGSAENWTVKSLNLVSGAKSFPRGTVRLVIVVPSSNVASSRFAVSICPEILACSWSDTQNLTGSTASKIESKVVGHWLCGSLKAWIEYRSDIGPQKYHLHRYEENWTRAGIWSVFCRN
jgi:hypothetical protein